ncbi:hypothetical protein H8959_015623 [Pygathrix nigripes]
MIIWALSDSTNGMLEKACGLSNSSVAFSPKTKPSGETSRMSDSLRLNLELSRDSVSPAVKWLLSGSHLQARGADIWATLGLPLHSGSALALVQPVPQLNTKKRHPGYPDYRRFLPRALFGGLKSPPCRWDQPLVPSRAIWAVAAPGLSLVLKSGVA